MVMKIQTVQESIADNGIKILVHSLAGMGKTVLCATAQEKTLIINAESGMLSLGQNSDHLMAKGSPTFAPEMCDVVTVSTLDELEEVYNFLEEQTLAGERVYQWVALDSITEIAETVLKNELKKSPDPRKAYGQLQVTVLALLKSYRDLKHYDVIMSCKQQRVTDGETGISTFVPMMPGSKLHQQIPYLFDEVFCIRIGMDEDDNPFHYIQATRDLQYEAKDRSGTLSSMEPPSLKMIKEKIRSGVGLEDFEAEDEESEAQEASDRDGLNELEREQKLDEIDAAESKAEESEEESDEDQDTEE